MYCYLVNITAFNNYMPFFRKSVQPIQTDYFNFKQLFHSIRELDCSINNLTANGIL